MSILICIVYTYLFTVFPCLEYIPGCLEFKKKMMTIASLSEIENSHPMIPAVRLPSTYSLNIDLDFSKNFNFYVPKGL